MTNLLSGEHYILDMEANGLLEEVDKVWCGVLRNVATGEVTALTDPWEIFDIVNSINVAGGVFVGHNIIGYDNELMKKVIGTSMNRMVDTYVLSQILEPQRHEHSLESYYPDDKVQNDVWDHYHPVILERCISDTAINLKLFERQMKILDSWDCKDIEFIKMEHHIASEVALQSVRGCPIHREDLEKHITYLEETLAGLYLDVQDVLGTYIADKKTYLAPFLASGGLKAFIVKWADDEAYLDMIDGPFTKIDFVGVKLSQHARVKDVLLSLGWVPSSYTDKGAPKLPKGPEWDEVAELSGNEGLSALAQYGSLKNRLDILTSWRRDLRPDGRITHSAMTCGTPTARFKHRVIVNIPRPSSVFGDEMRSLIYCDKPDYVQVGWDLSGIELRMLAHFMGNKEFIDLVEDPDGDIHTFFWEKVTNLVDTRSQWKNVFYGYSYGASDTKLGTLCTALPVAERTPKAGKILRDTIETSTPSLGKLVQAVQAASLRGYLLGLDGRRVFMKSGGKSKKTKIGTKWVSNPLGVTTKDALNRLLQSGAAIVFKKAVCLILERVERANLKVESLIFYHDEGQNFVHKDHVEAFTQIVQDSVREAGEYFKLKISLDCDVMVGANWKDTH